MQFLDTEGNVGIQIGYDTNKNPSIIIKDDKGATIMTSQGITKDAIADGLIVNNMLGDKSVSKDKLNFPIVEAKAELILHRFMMAKAVCGELSIRHLRKV